MIDKICELENLRIVRSSQVAGFIDPVCMDKKLVINTFVHLKNSNYINDWAEVTRTLAEEGSDDAEEQQHVVFLVPVPNEDSID